MHIPPLADLVSQAQKGSVEAAGALYEQYCQIIFRYLYYRVGDQHTAEDLTSEVFIKMLQVLPKQNIPGSFFRSWLFQVARNLSIDHFRKLRVHPSSEVTEEIPSGEDPIEAVSEFNFDQDALLEALGCLSDEQKDVIIMRFIDGLSIIEVARAINRSEDAVKGLQRRGLISLRQSLKGLEDHSVRS